MPVLAMLEVVKEVVVPETVVPAVAALEVETLVLYCICFAAIRDLALAALVTTALNFVAFTYINTEGLIDSLCSQFGLAAAPPAVALAVQLFLAVFVVAGILKKEWRFGGRTFHPPVSAFSLALNPVSAVILLLNVFPVASYYMSLDGPARDLLSRFHKVEQEARLDLAASRPDIYYIIVDGCAHPQTLKELCGHDNSEFIKFLRDRGFYVVSRAASNYDRTEYSLCSSLNMQYLDAIPERLGTGRPGYFVEWRLIHDSSVQKILKRLGYKFVNVCSFSTGTDYMPRADWNLPTGLGNHFLITTLLSSPLRGLEAYFPILREVYAFSQLNQGEMLPEAICLKGPKFVFLHTELTHPPYLFDERGNKRPLPIVGMQSDWRRAEDYGKQVSFAEKRLASWIDNIIRTNPTPPVILIQADHGPGPFADMPAGADPHLSDAVRMKILSAYLLPDGRGRTPLYDTITPVNSFRAVLNHLFKAGLPLLPDKLLLPAPGRQYDWKDVSGQVTFGEAKGAASGSR